MRRRRCSQTIMTEALRMLDVPKDIPEDWHRGEEAAEEETERVRDDVSIADLGGTEHHGRRSERAGSCWRSRCRLQPATRRIAGAVKFRPRRRRARIGGRRTSPRRKRSASSPPGPTVPDFRGKSMRDVVEEASAERN